MSDTPPWNPVAPLGPQQQAAQERQADARARRLAEVGGAFANAPAAVAFLRACLDHANRQCSYQPGFDLGRVAFNEGRRDALAELVRTIDAALRP